MLPANSPHPQPPPPPPPPPLQQQQQQHQVGGSRTGVYVGNLDPSTTTEHLEALFSSCGEVTSVLMCGPDQGTHRYGFVDFATSTGQAAALRMAGTWLNGRTIKVGPAKGPGAAHQQQPAAPAAAAAAAPPAPQAALPAAVGVYVGNLDVSTTPEQLKAFFSQVGAVTHVAVCGPETGVHRYGFVDFATLAGQEGALKLNGKELNGRALKVGLPKGTGAARPQGLPAVPDASTLRQHLLAAANQSLYAQLLQQQKQQYLQAATTARRDRRSPDPPAPSDPRDRKRRRSSRRRRRRSSSNRARRRRTPSPSSSPSSYSSRTSSPPSYSSYSSSSSSSSSRSTSPSRGSRRRRRRGRGARSCTPPKRRRR